MTKKITEIEIFETHISNQMWVFLWELKFTICLKLVGTRAMVGASLEKTELRYLVMEILGHHLL